MENYSVARIDETAKTFRFPWPQPVALSISVMLEGWTADGAPGAGPMGNPLRSGVLDLQAKNWARYGVSTGAENVLRVFEKQKVTAVFYVSGIIAESNVHLVKRIVDAGHVVAAHAWAQDQMPPYQELEQQREDIARCVEVLQAATGQHPLGWMSPRCTPSEDTAQLLGSAGFLWSADTFDSDLPYVLDQASGLLGMPFSPEVNDMPLSIRYGDAPVVYSEVLRRLLTNFATTGLERVCFDMTVHSHVFGRPYGLIELNTALDIAKEAADVAHLTTHDELSQLYDEHRKARKPA